MTIDWFLHSDGINIYSFNILLLFHVLKLAPTLSTVQEGVIILQHQGPSLSMNGMSQYLVLLSAHCCKASLKISWERRCANSKTTISDSVGSFTSLLIGSEGILGWNLSSDIKLSALVCCLSLSIVVGHAKICFDFMQPMLWRTLSEAKQQEDYFNSIFGKHWASVHVMLTSAFSLQATWETTVPFYHSSHVMFICEEKRSFTVKVSNTKYYMII